MQVRVLPRASRNEHGVRLRTSRTRRVTGWVVAGLLAQLGCAGSDVTAPEPPLVWAGVASGTSHNLWDVWGSSATDVWAVGDGGTILHFAGAVWAPALDSVSYMFRGVWGSGPRDVWAAGFRSLDSTAPVLFHYDGTGWSRDASIADSLPWPPLSDVWGTDASNVWVVGYGGAIYHFDGSHWSDSSVSNWYYADRIWGTSATDVWIVGPGTVLHDDGSGWSAQSDSVLTARQLTAGWGARRDNLWAAGQVSRGFLHFDGAHWTTVSPADSASGFCYGMWGVSASRIWAVERTGSAGPGSGAIWQFDGARWTVATRDTVNLTGIWASSGSNAWVVGDRGAILHGTVAN